MLKISYLCFCAHTDKHLAVLYFGHSIHNDIHVYGLTRLVPYMSGVTHMETRVGREIPVVITGKYCPGKYSKF